MQREIIYVPDIRVYSCWLRLQETGARWRHQTWPPLCCSSCWASLRSIIWCRYAFTV